jgi:hypothetical protein
LFNLDNVTINNNLLSSIIEEKMEFDGEKYRTPKFKESFRYIYQKINELQRVENKTGDKISNVSRLVPLHPLELFF